MVVTRRRLPSHEPNAGHICLRVVSCDTDPLGSTPCGVPSPQSRFPCPRLTVSELSALAAALAGQYARARDRPRRNGRRLSRRGTSVSTGWSRSRRCRRISPATPIVRERFLREARTAGALVAPEHRADPSRRRDRRPRVLRHGIRGRRVARAAHPGAAVASSRRDCRPAARRRARARLRARARRDPPRRQGREHPDRPGDRARDGDRLRDRAPGRSRRRSRRRSGARDRALHEPRAGDRRGGRRAERHLRARRRRHSSRCPGGFRSTPSRRPRARRARHAPTPRLADVAPDVPRGHRRASSIAVWPRTRTIGSRPAVRLPTRSTACEADAVAADQSRSENSKTLISETQAQSVWKRAAELQAHTSSQPALPLPPMPVRAARPVSESSAYQLADVRASAVDARNSRIVRAAGAGGVRPGEDTRRERERGRRPDARTGRPRWS